MKRVLNFHSQNFRCQVVAVHERVTHVYVNVYCENSQWGQYLGLRFYREFKNLDRYELMWIERSELKFFGTSLSVRYGQEGPRHDPYSTIDVTVSRLGNDVRLHSGLLDYIEINGERMDENHPYLVGTTLPSLFEAATGMDVGLVSRYNEVLASRCRVCFNAKKFRYSRGYVGETLTICDVCGNIVSDNFNRSMVE